MGYAVLLVAVVIFAVLLAASGGRARGSDTGAKKPHVTGVSAASMKRSEVRERLLKLSSGKPPKDLSMGAMCYEMAAPPDRIDYTCPKCGEKTIYASGNEGEDVRSYRRMDFFEWELPACRKIISETKSIRLTLDESQFCAKCSPEVKDPILVLVVHYVGEKEPHRVEGVTLEDVQLLSEFFSGNTKHEGDFGVETALKDHVEQLERLLGIKLDTDE